MAPRTSPVARARPGQPGSSYLSRHPPPDPFHPPPDNAVFRDLLIFEERLKQNAARLVKRRRKYVVLLTSFIVGVVILSYRIFVLTPPVKPYGLLHYLQLGALLLGGTTIFLFFASGMYSERIGAANIFVPQANRALRYFNLYLNVRSPPAVHLFSLLSAGDANPAGVSSPALATPGSGLVFNPPSPTNPRGELLFFPRVSTAFKEGYVRYRAAYERRRSTQINSRNMQSWTWRLFHFRWRGSALSDAVPTERTPLNRSAPDGGAEESQATYSPQQTVRRGSRDQTHSRSNSNAARDRRRTRSGTNASVSSVASSSSASSFVSGPEPPASSSMESISVGASLGTPNGSRSAHGTPKLDSTTEEDLEEVNNSAGFTPAPKSTRSTRNTRQDESPASRPVSIPILRPRTSSFSRRGSPSSSVDPRLSSTSATNARPHNLRQVSSSDISAATAPGPASRAAMAALGSGSGDASTLRGEEHASNADQEYTRASRAEVRDARRGRDRTPSVTAVAHPTLARTASQR
ncbi:UNCHARACTERIZED [Ceraceosorus bombacis]|uniref:Transmembrane protein 188 n=1 Tax=Ceraceosorus bombacis TaxID=401625 RepID=A0A0P1BED7_9BASI|nr:UNCHARACTERIZED [Ceraceosorus bombacis]